MTGDAEGDSSRLHERARAFVRAFEERSAMPEPFDRLAVDIARYQAAQVPGYARLCLARGLDPGTFAAASDAPAVPTDAFKVSRVAAFPPGASVVVTFRTSGTTVGARGSHEILDLRTYDEAAAALGRWALAPDLPGRVPVLVLAPSPVEAPDSSLSHMLGLFVDRFGRADRSGYFVQDGVLEVADLDAHVARALVDAEPVLLLGTSFALVHLLDALGDAPFRLPRGSRVMQTGGFKGRSREVDGPTLRRELAVAFSIAEARVVSEYGMTELSSQFYEGTIRSSTARQGVFLEPPWARVVPVDPETLAPVAHGEEGIARIEDLLNVDSAFAVLSSDRVRRVEEGFELLGRAAGAPPRGCSIAIDELLGPAGGGPEGGS
jgi:hypothetical protein